ncbi:acyclic terpene utilization AtuA family protein [Nitrogeniibacter aestuarii]|uniref:acyclic terpene utilization AtuA family protein n=1 Tax=Nitrogeniibacter aestuarii TaxID=2815343 RepID=UPI001D113463|nr:acyclic terpene utilization AtuA family protein [Nitrogeniibacter aestuarii]
MNKESILIGCGAGFAGDRLDAAVPVVRELIARAKPAYLMFETLAERTLALAQLRRRQDPAGGYLPTLSALLRPVLVDCVAHRIPIIGNFGAANPVAGAQQILALARELGCGSIKVAAVTGDDMLSLLSRDELLAMPFSPATRIEPDSLVSANVYLGAEGIARALDLGADVIVTGRVADPALALGPMLHHFCWPHDDWDRLAAGVLAGHLLECGAQVTGGYFADPGVKDVPGLAEVGYPIAEIDAEGAILIGKPAGTGGAVTERTVKEQILYEIHDPAAYLTPDVTLDLSAVQVVQNGPDEVRVSGAAGKPRPPTLKGTVCFDGGWMGEGEISYAGPNCRARGLLAIDILRARLARLELGVSSHFDLIGVASVFNDADGAWLATEGKAEPHDVRLRMAVSSNDRRAVERALQEVEALYTAGPAGGGGVRAHLTPLMNSTSVFVERDAFEPQIELLEA